MLSKLKQYMYIMVVVAVVLMAALEVVVCVMISDHMPVSTIMMVAIPGVGILLFLMFACLAVRETVTIVAEQERKERLEKLKTTAPVLQRRATIGYLTSELDANAANASNRT